jgi:hypothetical protein
MIGLEKLKRLFKSVSELDSGEARMFTKEHPEGGYKMEDFLRQNEPHMETPMGALDIAMMLETQALDLYGHFAEKAE